MTLVLHGTGPHVHAQSVLFNMPLLELSVRDARQLTQAAFATKLEGTQITANLVRLVQPGTFACS